MTLATRTIYGSSEDFRFVPSLNEASLAIQMRVFLHDDAAEDEEGEERRNGARGSGVFVDLLSAWSAQVRLLPLGTPQKSPRGAYTSSDFAMQIP